VDGVDLVDAVDQVDTLAHPFGPPCPLSPLHPLLEFTSRSRLSLPALDRFHDRVYYFIQRPVFFYH
jgi:hypothetical protein